MITDEQEAEIVAVVNKEVVDAKQEIENARITHSKTIKILDEVLRYIEVQDATVSDVLFKRLHKASL